MATYRPAEEHDGADQPEFLAEQVSQAQRFGDSVYLSVFCLFLLWLCRRTENLAVLPCCSGHEGLELIVSVCSFQPTRGFRNDEPEGKLKKGSQIG